MHDDRTVCYGCLVSLRTEVIGGVTTFFTMAYIVFVNPAILSTEGTGMAFSGVLTATVLTCAVMTFLMGLYAKLPYALAPGMGLNAFFTYTLVLGRGVPWPTALGLVFWSGVLFLIISVTPIRAAVAKAIPASVRVGAAAGIGLFLTFIGFKGAGIVVDHPATLVTLGPLNREVLFFVSALVLIIVLHARRNPFAFLAGIALATVLGAAFGSISAPAEYVSRPDFSSVLFKLDLGSALTASLIPAMVSLFFTDLFDSLSTFVGVSEASGLKDEDGHPKNLKQGLIVDSFATLGAGLFGSSPGTTYIESASGIQAGARTGVAAMVTAACFVPCLFIAPVAQVVPTYATAPVLVVVGALMFRSVARVDLSRLEDLLPVFLTAVLIPLTFSITQGILWGFISHAVLYVMVGRARDVHPVMFAVAALSVGLLWLESA